MKKAGPWFVLVLLAVGAVFLILNFNLLGTKTYTATESSSTPSVVQTVHTDLSKSTLGTYQYECDDHVLFSMTPTSDMETIHIKPVGGSYPPDSVLTKDNTTDGVIYSGNGITFTAHGETVVLSGNEPVMGDSSINCSPVEFPDSAPFNFGN